MHLLTKQDENGVRETVELHSTYYVVRTVTPNGDIEIIQKRYSNVPTTRNKVMDTYLKLGFVTEEELRSNNGEG